MKSPELFAWLLGVACCLCATESKSHGAENAALPAADSMIGDEPGQVRDDNDLKMKLVWCPSGFVTMEQVEHVRAPATKDDEADEDDPKDKHALRLIEKITPVRVFLTRGYWLGKYEVTQGEWKRVMGTEPWKKETVGMVKEGDDFPATYVSWHDAMQFCGRLMEPERNAGRLPDGWGYTLPTEAQWERACRARTETGFSFGDDESKLGDCAWTRDNTSKAGESYAHRVGRKKPNPWGLCDMHGNVFEWCLDCYQPKLPGGRDPVVMAGNPGRVWRGGCWTDDQAYRFRSAYRTSHGAAQQERTLGFRIALCAIRHANPTEPDTEAPSAIDK